jgi:hypothetical protein
VLCRAVAVTAALALLAPAAAGAKGPVAAPAEGPDARGITVNASALARVVPPRRPSDGTIRRALDAARPAAVSRALNEARRHAARLAQAAGLTLGEVVAIRQEDAAVGFFGFVEQRDFCRRRGRSRRLRCQVPEFFVASVTVTFATPETNAAPVPDRTVSAAGSGEAAVDPGLRRSSRSIRAAILRATLAAEAPEFAAARQQGEALARVVGAGLGPVLSIAEQPNGPYGEPLYAIGVFGPFGVGRFCGTIRRPVFRRDPQTGRRRVVRRVRRHRCFFPREITASVRVTFAGSSG